MKMEISTLGQAFLKQFQQFKNLKGESRSRERLSIRKSLVLEDHQLPRPQKMLELRALQEAELQLWGNVQPALGEPLLVHNEPEELLPQKTLEAME